MTLRGTFFTLAMLAAAWQPLQAQPPGLAAHQASNDYINCLMQAAHRIDDGHSNTASVGRTVQEACARQQSRWEDTMTARLNADQKRDFSEKMKAQTALIAQRMVAEERRGKTGN